MNSGRPEISFKLDTLREIFNIGVGGAATALNRIISQPVMMNVPSIELLRADNLVERLGPPDRPVVTTYVKVVSSFQSGILLIFDEASAKALVSLTYSGVCDHIEDEKAISALTEISNIMCSYFLNNLSKFMNKRLIPSVPSFAVDMLGAVLDSAVCDNTDSSLDVLMVETQLFNRNNTFNIDFLFFPENGSLRELFEEL